MSERTLKRIVVVVALLVFGYGLVTIVRSGLDPDDAGGGSDSDLARIVSELEPSGVDRVLLVDGGDTVRLAREEGRWTVNGFRADSGRVARFWNALMEEDPGDPVVRNPENHSRLGVTGEQAGRIVITTGDGERHEILVGDSGPSYPSVYVRTAGSDEVHLLQSSLSVSAGQSVTTWRDHTIVRVDTSRVQEVEVTAPTDAYTLSRADGDWTVDGAPATEAQARNLLGGLSRVLASDFYPVEGTWPESVTDAEDTTERRLVALASPDDTLASLTIRGSEGAGLAVRVAGDSTVYEIAPFDIGRLFPPREALLGEGGNGEDAEEESGSAGGEPGAGGGDGA